MSRLLNFNVVGIALKIRRALVLIDQALYRLNYKVANLDGDNRIYLPFFISAADLAAGTTQELMYPSNVDGAVIVELHTIIQTAIVTGGVITVKSLTTDVPGLSVTIADGATKGTYQSDTLDELSPGAIDVNAYVSAPIRIQVVPSAAFTGGGAVSGYVVIQLPVYEPE